MINTIPFLPTSSFCIPAFFSLSSVFSRSFRRMNDDDMRSVARKWPLFLSWHLGGLCISPIFLPRSFLRIATCQAKGRSLPQSIPVPFSSAHAGRSRFVSLLFAYSTSGGAPSSFSSRLVFDTLCCPFFRVKLFGDIHFLFLEEILPCLTRQVIRGPGTQLSLWLFLLSFLDLSCFR